MISQVTRKLSDVILQNRAAYTEELKRVTEVEIALAVTVGTSRNARRYFAVNRMFF